MSITTKNEKLAREKRYIISGSGSNPLDNPSKQNKNFFLRKPLDFKDPSTYI